MECKRKLFFSLVLLPLLGVACREASNKTAAGHNSDSTHACMQVPARFLANGALDSISSHPMGTENMVLIPAGEFEMGGDNEQADKDEYPKHKVKMSSFYIDITPVTNADFAKFVAATGYITTAELKPNWEEMKKGLPPGTAKPAEEMLVAASLVLRQTEGPVNLNDYGQWWSWVPGASWEHPEGPESNIKDRGNYPVVQVSWFDAMAYCKWAGKRLPTEAEWEYAARGNLKNNIYPWGNESINAGKAKANSWEGKFPYLNTKRDGFEGLAPVKSFAPNHYGLYDMAGNVWEWCHDWYDAAYYESLKGRITANPQGPDKSFDPQDAYTPKRILRGGSFLCNDSYCSGYRVARRMKSSPDTGLEHTGFRCVKDVETL